MKFSLPKNYIADYQIAKSIVDNSVTTYSDLWELIRKCQLHIEGAAPVPYEELKKKGLGWTSNDNFNKARAKIEKGVNSNVTKASRAIMLGYATFRDYDESKDKGKVTEFLKDEAKRGICASYIGYALANTLMKEHRLSSFLQDIEYPSYAFGFCPLLFDDSDWIPEPVHPIDIAFRPKSKPHSIKTWIVFKTIPASDLYEKWVKAKNDKITYEESNGEKIGISSKGWVVEALEEVLYRSFRGMVEENGDHKRPEEWGQIQAQFQLRPSYVIENTEDVTIAKIYHVEVDGSLSIVYIPYDGDRNPKIEWGKQNISFIPTSVNSQNAVDKRIYVKNIKNFRLSSKLILIRDSGFTENGYIENYRGIAKYAVKDSIRYNRILNNMHNKLMFSGAPFFEKSNTAIGETFKLGVGAGYIIAPAAYPLAPQQPKFDVGSDLAALRFSEGEYTRETESYDADLRGRLSSRPNKSEVQSQAKEVEEIDSAKNFVKFGDYSLLCSEIIRRFRMISSPNNVAKEGQKRFYDTALKFLKDYAKDKSDINLILEAIDSFVLEPITADETTLTIAIQMAETPFARNRYKRMLLLSRNMPLEEINFGVPMASDKLSNFQDERIAIIENDLFWNSNEAIIQGTDDHIIHLNVHLSKGQRVVEGVKTQTLAPDVAYKYLMNLTAHSGQHLDLLGRDPTLAKKIEEYTPVFKQLIKDREQIRISAEQIMEAQARKAQEVQLDPETQNKIASRNAETQAKIQRSDILQEVRTSQTNRKMELEHQRALIQLQLDQEVELEKARSQPTEE